jgi:small-conductance mechanosensitive channel/CRP-like cAMP-binding protein
MNLSLRSAGAFIISPQYIAPAILLGGWWCTRYWRRRSSLLAFFVQILAIIAFTSLLTKDGITPYRPVPSLAPDSHGIYVGGLEIMWWLAAAWTLLGFLRAFVTLGQRPHEAKLLQELCATLIYAAVIFGIIGYVFDLPLRGLLATSGAIAIIIGLALQSTLSDVFSGIVLSIERPYRVGDWLVVDDSAQGTVIETNWRATRILTASCDEASFPNSVLAKSRLINRSRPTRSHGATLCVKLSSSLAPSAGCRLLSEILLGSTKILRDPPPTVTVKDMSAEMTEWELFYFVSDINDLPEAQNELFERIHRSTAAAGVQFAPRLSAIGPTIPDELSPRSRQAAPERLLRGISLFSSLTPSECEALTAQLVRRDYRAGEVIVSSGTVVQALCILSYGVLIAAEHEGGRPVERVRLTPGNYFGEMGLLTGQALNGEIRALTDVVIYEISKDAIWPLLQARPHMVVELGEALAELHLGRSMESEEHSEVINQRKAFAVRITSTIKRLFSLH